MPIDPVPFKHPWPEVPLWQHAGVTVGGTPSTAVASFWEGGTVRWMSSGDVHLKRINDVSGRITERGLLNSAARIVDPPCVAVALAGQGKTRGTVALTFVPLSTNQSVAIIKPDETELSAAYLYHDLDFRYEELRSRSLGGGRAGLTKTVIEGIPVPLPDFDEQTAIAAILDTVDDTIRQTAAVIEKLKKIKAGLLHDLLTRGIDEDGQLRDPVRHPEQFKDSPLGKVPKGWEVRSLAQVADIMFSSVDKKARSGERPVRLCNYIDAYNNEYLTGRETFFMLATATEAEIGQFALRQGDILMTKDSETPDDIGIPSVITAEPTELVCGYHLALVRPDRKQMNAVFLAKQLRHHRIAQYFGRMCNGLTRYGLPTSAFANAAIVAPPLPEQEGIAAILRAHDDRISEETRTMDKFTLMKLGLMQDLLTGRVRVPMKANGKAPKR